MRRRTSKFEDERLSPRRVVSTLKSREVIKKFLEGVGYRGEDDNEEERRGSSDS